MSPLDAVAAAIRERLLEGKPAPLPGLGTLVRKHIPARVKERADGRRVMLPPGETIGLDAAATGAESLALPFARFSALSPDVATRAYANAMDQVEALLAATGEVRLPGVGLLRRTSTGVVLGVEADLLAAVNRTYEGLEPVQAQPAEGAAPALFSPTVPGPRPVAPVPPAAFAPVRPMPPPPAPGSSAPPTPPAPPESPVPEPDPSPRVSPPVEPVAPRPVDLDGPLLTPPSEDAPPDAPPAPRVEPSLPQGWTPPVIEVVPSSDADDAPPADLAPPSDLPPLSPEPDEPPPATLATPFGEPDGPPLSDVLPPTPPERTPAPSAPTSAPLPDDDWADDEWAGDTWASPAFGAPPSFDSPADRSLADADLLGSLIEDADFDVVDSGPPATPPPPAVSPPAEPADQPPLPSAPPSFSEPETDPLSSFTFPTFDSPAPAPEPVASPEPEVAVSPPPPPPVAALAAEDAPEPTRRRRWGLWVALFLLLALAAAAVALFWPDIESRFRGSSPPGETITAEATPTPAPLASDVAVPDSVLRTGQAATVTAGDDVLASPIGDAAADDSPSSTADGEPTATDVAGARPAGRPTQASRPRGDSPVPQTGLGQSPAPGIALLPPRVTGLDPADVRALTALDSPIEADAEAWTLVVLSTSSRDEAEALRERYRRAGYRTAVLTSRSGNFRVAVGQYASRDHALRLLDRLPPQAPADTWALDLQTL